MRMITAELQSTISLICGIVVVVSLFMSWFSATLFSGYGMTVTYSANGWDVIGGEVPFIGPVGPVFTLTGGILMILFALTAFALPRVSTEYNEIFDLLVKAARAAPLFVVFGVFFFTIDARSSGCGGLLPMDWIGFAPWMALPFALFGIGFGVTRHAPVTTDSRRFENTGNSSAAVRSMRREMLERQLEDKRQPERPAGDAGMAKDHFNRASDYESRGQDDQAIAAYTEAIEADPRYALAYYYRGSLYGLQERSAEALNDFQKVIEISDDSDLISMAKKRIEKLRNL